MPMRWFARTVTLLGTFSCLLCLHIPMSLASDDTRRAVRPQGSLGDFRHPDDIPQPSFRLQAQADIEGVLKSQWAGMRAALLAGDVAGALQFFAVAQRPRYQALFTAMGSNLPNVARTMPDLGAVNVMGERAVGTLQRRQQYGGQMVTLTQEMSFVLGTDGRWYIEEF